MIAGAALAPSNPIARITAGVFALIPAWLPLLILRLALARPFFASGLTRWDGWFTLSFGTKTLFAEDYKPHSLAIMTFGPGKSRSIGVAMGALPGRRIRPPRSNRQRRPQRFG